MNKPLSVSKEEFKSGLISLINGSELPPCLVEEIIGGIFSEVKILAHKQYENDLAQLKSSQESQN